jgi:Holliday junction resolvase-like predicted endonuclease
MDILKSSRHSKITGDFGEALVLYWLSKYGFECARVDHIGIDLIARNPHTDEVMGISVKSRCRNPGKEQTYVRIPVDDLKKARDACDAFGCVPYFAVVVDASKVIRGFIMPMSHLVQLFPPTATSVGWKMTDKYLTRYYSDPEIKIFELHMSTARWWQSRTT